MTGQPSHTKTRSFLLWFLSVFLMFCAVVYQRGTGPTYPMKGYIQHEEGSTLYRLIRSDWSIKTNEAANVVLPRLDPAWSGALSYKRYRTQDDWTKVPMEPEVDEDGEAILAGKLPAQPAAGKLEYFLELNTGGEPQRIPESAKGNVVIRFKDHVPGWVLIPHIVFMFFSVLIGMRAGLGAVLAPDSMRRWAWTAFIGMTIGGMILGPIVQKYAFGEYWTGFPWGSDWTDNKMLIMWLAWLIAVGVSGIKARARGDVIARWAIVIGSIAMTGAYLIPHSMGGSELDYSQVDQGIDPSKAIETGKK